MIARHTPEVANAAHSCPVCGARATRDFLQVPRVPVTCTSIFATPAEARAIPSGNIDLCACVHCGFVFNRSFDPKLGELGARYESSQAASAHFSAFAKSLADDWLTRYRLRGKSVLEVGCGGGDFLRQLVASGAARGIGIDPLAQATENESLRLIAETFPPQRHDMPADALICRHTLEHVQDVAGFLRDVHRWAANASGRVVLFELPDAERVFAERAFWDVYYEHCNYFTAHTVRSAFELAGFTVLRVARVYNEQYLLVEAEAGTVQDCPVDATTAAAIAVCEQFAQEVRASVTQCMAAFDRLAAEGPRVVLWQGAAKTVGLLAFMGDTRAIECAIDLSPQRHGQFLPGTGLSVHAPDELVRLQPKHIVLMNPVYLTEVRAAVGALGVHAQVHSINDLLHAAT